MACTKSFLCLAMGKLFRNSSKLIINNILLKDCQLMLQTPNRGLDFQSSPSHSFLKKGSNTFRKSESITQPIGTFSEFNLSNIRDKASQKHGNFFQSPIQDQRSLSRSELESPAKLFSLKEKISSIGNASVKKSTITLSSNTQSQQDKPDKKFATFQHKSHFMPDKLKFEDITAIRMQLESATQDHVANLSSHYVNELVRVQQSIFRSLKQLPQYKGKIFQ